MKNYDAIIIGSGQAGTPLAFSLAAKNKRVLVIEKEQWGGTCVNTGCVPSKTYIASARRIWEVAHSNEMGIDVSGSFSANMQKIKARKDAFVGDLVASIKNGLAGYKNVDTIEGKASFVSDKIISVNNKTYTAPQIFINVGARASIPKAYENIPYLTNKTMLELTTLPEHLIIIGGSYIGLEFGQMFKRFGSTVTIIERGETIIKNEDAEVSETVLDFMKKDGVEFLLNAKTIEPHSFDNEITVTINGSAIIEGTHLLVATGRIPNTDTLQLQNTGINSSSKGYVEVDDYGQTNIEGVFALGDCNGKGTFTHTSYNDYQVVENYLFGDKSRKISDRITTYCIFTDPPLGRAGLTKKEAIAKGYKVLEGRREMQNIKRARAIGEMNGFISVLVDAETNLILGATVLGAEGDEIVTGILNVMRAQKPYTLIRDTVVSHPTISELIPTLLEQLKPATV